jgi:hypothetical protein
MMKKFLFLLVLSVVSLWGMAQKIYDPVLDPDVVINRQLSIVNGQSSIVNGQWSIVKGQSYMWYPGQLAAYRQQWLLERSQERCVNVGYVGKFNPMQEVTWFKVNLMAKEATTLEFATAGAQRVEITDNGKAFTGQLAKGKHEVIVKVSTSRQLPALMIKDNDKLSITNCQSSNNQKDWLPVESDARFNNPDVSPNTRINDEVIIQPKNVIALKNFQSSIVNGQSSIVNCQLKKNGSVIYDFWYDEVGTVELEASGTGALHFTVGESIEEVMNENTKLFEQQPIEDVPLSGSPKTITLPERALRYVKVTASEACTIHDVKFRAMMWPVNEMLMTFESSDASLNDLFNAGVATLHTSMHDFNLDGIKRDFLPWSMDAVASMLGMNLVMGDRQVARNNISICLMPPHPQTSHWGIVDYPLHALIGLKQDYLRFGDLSSFEMFKDRIFEQMDFYINQQDENGFIHASKPSSGFIPGWSRDNGPDDYGVACYPQIMLYMNFRIAAYFCQLTKENAKSKDYTRRADQLEKNIYEHFWDNTEKAFVNGYREDGSLDKRISHHAQYWAILAGIYPERLYDYMYESVITAIPYYKDNISYEKGYEALAYIKAGRTEELLQLLDEVWGDWLRQGYTRFPENFRVNSDLAKQLEFYGRPFGLSLCHGANGAPPVVLAAYGIFGFSQSDKPINAYTLTPNLLHLDWAKGRIPVKEGFIHINLQKNGHCEVEIPAGCQVTVNWKGRTQVLKKAGKYVV